MRGGGLTGTFIGEPVLVPLLVVALVALLLLWWWWPCEAVPAGGGAKMKGVCTEEEAEVGVQRDDPLLPFWIFFFRGKKKKKCFKMAPKLVEKSHRLKTTDTRQCIYWYTFLLFSFSSGWNPFPAKQHFQSKKTNKRHEILFVGSLHFPVSL